MKLIFIKRKKLKTDIFNALLFIKIIFDSYFISQYHHSLAQPKKLIYKPAIIALVITPQILAPSASGKIMLIWFTFETSF